MERAALLLLLLQGGLLTALAESTTLTPAPDQERNQSEASIKLPLYKVNGKTGEPCILLEMDAFVSVSWDVSSNKTFQMDMNLEPSKVEVAGSCGKDEAQLSLSWGSFHLQWNFSKTRDWEKWFAKEVELQYDKSALEHQSNGTSGLATLTTKSSSDVMLFSAPVGEAYHCASEYELDLGGSGSDRAVLNLSRFRVQPFLEKPEFGQSYCPSHSTSSATMSSTVSATSSDSGTTNAADTSSSETSFHTNFVSSNLVTVTPSPVPPSGMTTPNKGIGTQTSAHFHSPHTSTIPFTRSMKQVVSSDPVGSPAISPTTADPKGFGAPNILAASLAPLPPYVYQKTLSNVVKMPFYPPKKVFFSGVKLDSNDALSAMLWSWYTSGFYTGYYQALQKSK